jgi:hypothetical protein
MYESDEGWWPSKKESTGMQVFLGRPDGGIGEERDHCYALHAPDPED